MHSLRTSGWAVLYRNPVPPMFLIASSTSEGINKIYVYSSPCQGLYCRPLVSWTGCCMLLFFIFILSYLTFGLLILSHALLFLTVFMLVLLLFFSVQLPLLFLDTCCTAQHCLVPLWLLAIVLVQLHTAFLSSTAFCILWLTTTGSHAQPYYCFLEVYKSR